MLDNKNTFYWWILVFSASLLLGGLLYVLHMPGGWLVGALIGTLVISVLFPAHPKVSSKWLTVGQAILGSFMASRMDFSSISVAGHFMVPMIAVVMITIAVSVCLALVLTAFTPISKTTAILGSLPGGAGMMVAISIDAKDADPRIVSLMQYLRLSIVILMTAVIAHFVVHTSQQKATLSLLPVFSVSDIALHWKSFLATPFLAFFGAWAGKKVKLPGSSILGPLIICIAAKAFHIVDPMWLPGFLPIAYLIIGMYVGTLFDKESLRYAGKVAPAMAVITIAIICVCAVTGGILSAIAHLSYLSGYLATTPGGVDSVAAIAIASESNLSFILAVQIIRMLFIVFLGPFITYLIKNKNIVNNEESPLD